MQIENSFSVAAAPDRVYAYLLDVNRVAGCVPGAEVAEIVDPDTFKGKVKIKVGPISVGYSGTARITKRDPEARLAELEAEGRETTGPGSARASAVMTVTADGAGSVVKISTDFTVAGRVAQFGRGVMEDVSRRIVGQMAECIKANLEGEEVAPAGAITQVAGGSVQEAVAAPPVRADVTAKPVNALTLIFQIVWDGIRRLFSRR